MLTTQKPPKPHPCPHSKSIISCTDDCKTCKRMSLTGHDWAEPVFREFAQGGASE